MSGICIYNFLPHGVFSLVTHISNVYPCYIYILNLLLSLSIDYSLKSKIYIDILRASPMQWYTLELQRSQDDPSEF